MHGTHRLMSFKDALGCFSHRDFFSEQKLTLYMFHYLLILALYVVHFIFICTGLWIREMERLYMLTFYSLHALI